MSDDKTLTEEPSSEEAAAIAAAGHNGPVILKDRYLIDLASPLVKFDTPSASAFAVSDRRDAGSKQFALICTPGLPVRGRAISFLMSDAMDNMLPFLDYGAVFWPLLRQKTMAVIYEQPLGGRISDTFADKAKHISDHDLASLVIAPVVRLLRRFDDKGMTHRSVRPKNIFFMDEERKEVVLGDCVTTPPGFDQPAIYETIERGMASPGGRGDATISEDIYALGVSAAFIILKSNPTEGMSQAEMLKSKIEQGTYATICGKMRMPVHLIEPLRGMLSDDPLERWDFETLASWLDGQRRTPIQKKPSKKSDQPFVFAEVAHMTPRSLAYLFTKNVKSAIKTINGNELITWLRRKLHSEDLSDAVTNIIAEAKLFKDKQQGRDDYVVTKTSMIFDPEGAICYKGFAFIPEGYGAAMAVELLRNGSLQIPAEVLAHDIVSLWVAEQSEYNTSAMNANKLFGKLKRFAQSNDMGYGIERVLYELNPTLPCQSSLIKEDYVVYIEDLLPALDDAANRVEANKKPMDRHIAAFIAARFNQDVVPHLAALSLAEEEKSLIGMLSLLAFLQWHLKIGSLLGLSSWVGGLLGPAINTYHSRKTRRGIEREIPKLVRKGSLPELFDLIDNIEKRKKDGADFDEAVRQFADTEKAVNEIEGDEEKAAANAKNTGQKTAAMISIILSTIAVTILFLFKSV